MKKKISNIGLVLAFIAGLIGSILSPYWWLVWLVCFPVMYGSAIALLGRNTNWIRHY